MKAEDVPIDFKGTSLVNLRRKLPSSTEPVHRDIVSGWFGLSAQVASHYLKHEELCYIQLVEKMILTRELCNQSLPFSVKFKNVSVLVGF